MQNQETRLRVQICLFCCLTAYSSGHEKKKMAKLYAWEHWWWRKATNMQALPCLGLKLTRLGRPVYNSSSLHLWKRQCKNKTNCGCAANSAVKHDHYSRLNFKLHGTSNWLSIYLNMLNRLTQCSGTVWRPRLGLLCNLLLCLWI